jgi:hypothetical protein
MKLLLLKRLSGAEKFPKQCFQDGMMAFVFY